MGRRRTARAVLLVAAIVGTAAFGYLSIRNVHPASIWQALKTSNYWWTIPSLAAIALAVVMRAERWRLLFRKEGRPSLSVTTHALLISYFFNNLLPARAGELARVIDLRRRAGISRAETATTVVLERLYDVVALGLLLFIFLPWLPPLTWLRAVEVLLAVVVGALAITVTVLMLFGDRPLRLALRPLGRIGVSPPRADAIASSIGHGLTAIRDLRVAINVLVWTLASWFVAAASAWVLMIGFRLQLPFAAAIVVVVAVNLAQVLPSLPSGLGVVEAATVLALHAYNVGSTHALAYALVYHALNFLPFVAAGPFVLGSRSLAFWPAAHDQRREARES